MVKQKWKTILKEFGIRITYNCLSPSSPKSYIFLLRACSVITPTHNSFFFFVETLNLLRIFPALKKNVDFSAAKDKKCYYPPFNQNTFQNIHHLLASLTRTERKRCQEQLSLWVTHVNTGNLKEKRNNALVELSDPSRQLTSPGQQRCPATGPSGRGLGERHAGPGWGSRARSGVAPSCED